ncbi:MAG: KamA family radical SAM protein [Victivallaceae bacterium]|nr:KamA family radical SAM protein [Victivallaceae bacterium]
MSKYYTASQAAEMFNIELPDECREVDKIYPALISEYYLNLIEREDPQTDPIWQQVMPHSAELADDGMIEDGLGEVAQSPTSRLIHRYADRAVLLTTGRCATRCRFCFRKRAWRHGGELGDISDSELDDAIDYLKANNQLREVLISGGDPLMLSNRRLQTIIDKINTVQSIEVIRIASRIPVTWPQRINRELIDILSAAGNIWFLTHFNHPQEITEQSTAACQALINAGIPVLNQSVLLKGINNSAGILEELFRKLVKIKVKPHYLFHIDPVHGVWHFATGIKRGLEIMRELRPRLSSLATPIFAIDLPDGGGKVNLQPNYRTTNGFTAIDGRIIEHPGKNM